MRIVILSAIVAIVIAVACIGCSTDANGLTFDDAKAIGDSSYNYAIVSSATGGHVQWFNSYEIRDGRLVLYEAWVYSFDKWVEVDVFVYGGSASAMIEKLK